MFNTFQAACSAITSGCSSTTTYTTRVTNLPVVGNALYVDSQASILAGSGYIVKENSVYTIVDGIITAITTCAIPTPAPTPVVPSPTSVFGNRIKYVYTGNPNLYVDNNSVYDSILNRFARTQNTIQTIVTTGGLNIGDSITGLSVNLQGNGYIAYFDSGILKKVKLQNGVVIETASIVTPSLVTNPTSAKTLFPFAHYENGQYIGNGFAQHYQGNFNAWLSKIDVGVDGLTLTDVGWDYNYYPQNGDVKYWKLNKGFENHSRLTNFKLPESYKGNVVDIQIMHISTGNKKVYFHSILIPQ